MTEPTSDLVKRLDELRLKAFHSNAPHDLYEYHNALSSAFQNRELVPAARIRALEAEVGELTKQRDGAIANLKEANADVLEAGEDLKEAIQRAEDADRRVAEEREQCAAIASSDLVSVDAGIILETPEHHHGSASRWARNAADRIASAIRSRSNGAEPDTENGVTARSQGASPISAFGSDSADALSGGIPCKVPAETLWKYRDAASGEDDDIIGVRSATLFEMCVELELRRHDEDLERAQRSPSAVSEDVNTNEVREWSDKLRELHAWTASAVLAGETEFTEAIRGDLYGFLCSLIGYLMAGEELERERQSSPDTSPTAVGDEVEVAAVIRDAMADLKGARHIARAVLSHLAKSKGSEHMICSKCGRDVLGGDGHGGCEGFGTTQFFPPLQAVEAGSVPDRNVIAAVLARYAPDAFSSTSAVVRECTARWPDDYGAGERACFLTVADRVVDALSASPSPPVRETVGGIHADDAGRE